MNIYKDDESLEVDMKWGKVKTEPRAKAKAEPKDKPAIAPGVGDRGVAPAAGPFSSGSGTATGTAQTTPASPTTFATLLAPTT